MSRSRTILRGILFLLVGQLWTWGLRLVETTIVPQRLGDKNIGILSFAGTLITYLSLTVWFGGSEHVIRSVAADPRDGARIANAQMVTRVVLFGPLLILSFLLLVRFNHPGAAIAIVVALLMLNSFLAQIYDVMLAWRQGLNQFKEISLAGMVGQSVGLPSGIGLVLAGFKMAGAAWGQVLGTVAAITTISLQPDNPVKLSKPRRSDVGRMVREGFPYLRYTLFLKMYGDESSVLYIGWLAGFAAVGWYYVAIKLVGVLFFVPQTIVQSIMPTLTHAYEHSREDYEALAPRFVNLTLTLAIPFAALLILRSDALVHVLYHGKFYHAGILLKLVGFGLWMRWASVCYGALLIITGRPAARANAATVAAPFNLIITPILVWFTARLWHNGAIGAIVAAETTELLIVLQYLQHFRGTGIPRKMVAVTLRAIPAVLVSAWVLQLGMYTLPRFLAAAALAVLAFLPAALLTGALPREDMKLLAGAMSSKFRK